MYISLEDCLKLEKQILEKEKQIVKKEQQNKQVKEAAECARDIYNAYISAGFSKEQAWELLSTITKNVR